ncbi:MAG: hypothetical protein HUJ63_00945, partial [Enterococcus sp.]|nr:hypothetical protein [Enterococcus sp.]
MENNKGLLTVSQVATAFGVSKQNIYSRCKTSFEPYVVKQGKTIMLSAEVLDKFLKEKPAGEPERAVEPEKASGRVDYTDDYIKSLQDEIKSLREQVQDLSRMLENQQTLNLQTMKLLGEPAEEKPVPSGREVKDSEGKYYNVGKLNDAAGNLVFTTIYPEDFSEISTNINYDIYSTRYPECITYVVGNQDGNVRMTYMSPQHYWYRKSTNKKTRSNERDVYDFMQFYTYSGAQGFIETMIKESYTDIKGFKLTGKEEFSPETTAKTEAVSKAQTMYLTGGNIGDYGKIAEDTEYAAMAAEFEAYLYHYEATSRQNNTIYMDFYVPVIANELGYATALDDDQGTIIEWILPEFVAFEAGNEELHNEYM